jgi:zinc transport system substrate-binding protein
MECRSDELKRERFHMQNRVHICFAKRFILFGVFWFVITFLPVIAGAGGDNSGKITIYVVNYPLKYFAERIAGDHAEVVFPAPPDCDPAYWIPDVKTIGAYQKADLILLNGANYAKWVRKASLPRSRMVDTSAKFKDRYITAEEALTHSHGAKGAHAHESLAFTTWLDFDFAAKQAQAITKALSRKKPNLHGMFQENYAALEKDLMALDGEIKAVVSKNPTLPLLASHPVYDYLSRRYGLNMKSVHWEPDEVPNDGQWIQLENILKSHPAKWMIWEGNPMKTSVDGLKSLGVASLVFDPCGNVPGYGDFLTVMQQNVDNLKPAFR